MRQATLTSLPVTTTEEEILEVIHRDGAVIVDEFIPKASVARVLDETRPYIDVTSNGKDRFSGTRTTRTGALVARSSGFRDILADKQASGLAWTFLRPWCTAIQLSVTQLIRLKPGQGAQPLHRDRGAWPHLVEVEPQLNFIIALTEFTENNGATVVIPGSAQWDKERQPQPHESTCAVMSPGSALVFTGSVLHGGGANDSQSDRIALYFDFVLGWLRQEENQYLSCPPDIARQFTGDLQALIGYAHGSYALGYYSPPSAPGEEPEVVGPGHAVGQDAAGDGFGDGELLEATASAVGRYSPNRA